MLKPLDYAAEEKKARQENVEKLVEDIDNSATTIKILNFSEKFDLDPFEVKSKIQEDPLFALFFIKDPLKQSLHETLAAQHIQNELPLVQNFEQLKSRGSEALYVQKGEVVHDAQLSANYTGKSLDFHWQYKTQDKCLDVYAMHKHTRSEGGAQDNQHTDLKLFLDEAKPCEDPDKLFIAICDGPYYQKNSTGDISRIENLRTNFVGNRSAVCDINELPVVWHDALLGWHVHHDMEIASADAEDFEKLSEHVDDYLVQEL